MNKKKEKQEDLPAMEGPGVSLPKFKDLDRLGDKFISLRDEKAELATKLGDVETNIVEKMIAHGISRYRFSDQEIILKPSTNHIKIKTVKVSTAPVDYTDSPPEE